MQKYDPQKIETKWQKFWEKKKLFKTPVDATPENKYYILPQLPYPSGSGLHVGHAEVYSACDIYARFKRMTGKKVMQVVGWDSFGLPAENYAIKNNIHPQISTDKAIDNFRKQIKSLGISVDWDREVGSHNSDYYKWTQWFFLLFYKRGLAYRKKQAVNWCDSCKTVLANDQVKEGHCERCDTLIVQRDMEQWYIKITEYADKLLEGLDRVDWPEESKKRQRDWIGRSEGASVSFTVIPSEAEGSLSEPQTIEVFTTRPDTLFGATYMVLAPEGEYVQKLKSNITNWDEVEKYIKKTSKKTELDRQVDKEKTGVQLKGVKAINPVNNEEIPIWTADYVMASYGTGAIMAVPAHDERDFEFASKFGLKIRKVVKPEPLLYIPNNAQNIASGAPSEISLESDCFIGEGISISSDFLNGLETKEAKKKMIEWLEKNNVGRRKIQYKLRDWSVSRQRFWGAPIPMLVRNKEEGVRNNEYDTNPDFVLNLHAWGSDPDQQFHPWISKELKSLGIKSATPLLPDPEHPRFNDWSNAIKSELPRDTNNTVITGRSLSCWITLSLAQKMKFRKLVLAAPSTPTKAWYAGFGGKEYWGEAEKKIGIEFFGDKEDCLDFKKIGENVAEIVILLSTNDPYIPPVQTRAYFEKYLPQARIIIVREAGHFDIEHGCKEFPLFLNEIINPVRPDLRPLSESDLPVLLPSDVDFKPTGQSPLTYSKDFQKGVEKKYGKGWQREPDTLDTFMCSSWYYYRYLDPKNSKEFASPEALKKWMPVDFYLGGPEHVNGHLLYSRFFTKVLFDAGYIDFDEPFQVHRHQGLILGPDNRKMSKRWGNVVNPTDVVNEYGADTCRMYEMFMGPLEDDKPWDTNGVKGVRRFLDKVWGLQSKVKSQKSKVKSNIDKLVHKTIKKVGEDLEKLSFNTAISEMMKLVNEMNKEKELLLTPYSLLLKILSPFAPHICEELWSKLGNKDSICTQSWPEYDSELIKDDEIKLVIQVNGKVRGEMTVAVDISEDDAKSQALQVENVVKWLDGKEPKKVIYVKGKLVSVVV